MEASDYISNYLQETQQISQSMDLGAIQKGLECLQRLKASGGRLFILGVGGSAGNASHAVNDFRKIAGIESYAPTDNVSELTARTNDEGWETIFVQWLKTSRLNKNDVVMVLSVGGGTRTTSQNLVLALEYARAVGAGILGIVSRDGGMTRQLADVTILIPVVAAERITPHAEGWQGIVWHLWVNAIASL